MQKEEVCSKGVDKGAGIAVSERGHEIEGGCPVFKLDSPATIEKLAMVGKFNPHSAVCNKCNNNKNYRRCIPIYNSMPIEDKMIVDAILESKNKFFERTLVDCSSRIPASS